MARSGMKVIVTGASMGIGRGIARVLARNGCALGVLARSEAALEELSEELHEYAAVAYAPCDLRRWDQAGRAIRELTDALGGLDAIVNNAGLVIRKSIIDLSLDEWHDMVETNINGLYYGIRAALPTFLEQGHGHIVNVSSISGRVPLPGGSAYAATKYAVTGLSQSMFQELRDHGIKVTTVYPGSVDSASERHDSDADHSWKVTPDEIGEACHFALTARPGTLVSEIEVRPLNKPPAA